MATVGSGQPLSGDAAVASETSRYPRSAAMLRPLASSRGDTTRCVLSLITLRFTCAMSLSMVPHQLQLQPFSRNDL